MELFKFASFLAIFCGLLAGSTHATYCDTRYNRCLDTLRVSTICPTPNSGTTSECTCDETSTYTKVDTGCALTAAIPTPTIDAGVYSGDVHVDATLTLTCSTPTYTITGNGEYEWYVDGTKQNSQTARTWDYSPSAAAEDKQITCKIVEGPLSSETSAQFNVKSYATGSNPSRSPTITAPAQTAALANSEVTYECVNIPKDGDLIQTWSGASTDANQDAVIAAADLDGSALTCTLTLGNSRTFSPAIAVSTTVLDVTPATPAAGITGVEIYSHTSPITVKEGETNNLRCRATPTTLAITEADDIDFSWEIGGAQDSTTNTQDTSGFTVGTKSVVCKGTPTSGTVKSSSTFSVVVSNDLVVAKVVYAPTPIVETGYLAIRCIIAAEENSGFDYSWQYDNEIIVGQTDHTLQIGRIANADHGNSKAYKCTVTKSLYTSSDATAALSATAIASVTPTVSSDKVIGRDWGTGSTYTLTCSVTSPETTGLTFVWYKDGTAQTGETASTYTITATSSAVVYKCKASFLGTDTGESADFSVTGVAVTYVSVSGLVNPVRGTSVTLTCECETGATSGASTYQWTKGGSNEGTSATYTISSVAAADDVVYTCACTADGTTETSADFLLSSVATPETPYVTVPSIINAGGTYTLTCNSDSALSTTTATYNWYKVVSGSDTALTGSSRTYTISNIATANEGDYKCKITINSQESSVSAAATIGTIGTDKGLPCTSSNFHTVCTTNFNYYNGNCIKQRCECQTGVTLYQDACGGAAGVVASVLLMLMSVLAARLL